MPLLYSVNEQEVLFEKSGSILHISKPDGSIRVSYGSIRGQKRPVAAIVGIIRLRLAKYVIVVKEAELAGKLWDDRHEIMKVKEIDFIPLREWRVKDDSERQYLHLLRSHLSSATLFFSTTWDLTNPLQRQGTLDESVPLWERSDDRFFWNRYVSSDLIDAARILPPADQFAASQFIQPMIYGVVSIQHTTIHNKRALFGIITRRSRFRAGTRYFRRGIDSQGNVANYNETEQLLTVEGQHVFSYVQTRGSVPAYWGEVNDLRYKPMLKIGENVGVDAAKAHFDNQIKEYGKNILVNLVNSKGYELPVKEAYERIISALGEKDLVYIYFDFHKECSKMRWYRVDVLLEKLISVGLTDFGFYEASFDTDRNLHPLNLQHGVVRTNCMDCLDRTNVVQSHIGKWVLQKQLEKSGVVPENSNWETDAVFLKAFRAAWGDNADGVSCSYSGTGALKTDFTRLGKRTKGGALQDLRNSIVRYLKNNFFDGPRQDGFDLFLGNHLPYETVQPPFTDLRPVYIQSVPYIIVGTLIMIGSLILFPREENPWIVNKGFMVFCVCVLVQSVRVFVNKGLQYVNWPKLLPVDFLTAKDLYNKQGESKGRIFETPGGRIKYRDTEEFKSG